MRPVAASADSFGVGSLLRRGGGQENVIAIQSFYWTAAQESAQVRLGDSAFACYYTGPTNHPWHCLGFPV